MIFTVAHIDIIYLSRAARTVAAIYLEEVMLGYVELDWQLSRLLPQIEVWYVHAVASGQSYRARRIFARPPRLQPCNGEADAVEQRLTKRGFLYD